MRNGIRHPGKISCFAILVTASLAPGLALAQSGSAGGSIGNDEKSLSSSRSTPRAVEPEQHARPSRPERETPRRASRGGGGGGGNFDGAWVVVGVGCGGTTSGAVVVTSGKIIGEGLTGYVSPSGAASSVGHYNGITVSSSGHVSAAAARELSADPMDVPADGPRPNNNIHACLLG
jgi:hypothetical protein